MSWFDALILGVIQGLTEFLPVSSSGHLELGRLLLGVGEPDLLFDITVHVATLVATVLFYRSDILLMAQQAVAATRQLLGGRPLGIVMNDYPSARLLLLLMVGTLPTGVIGVVFKEPLEALFGNPSLVAIALLVTAVLLISTRFTGNARRDVGSFSAWRALLIGFMQGFAIIPGISRSGATIACALLLGVERELAARFSFLLAIPAILGALVLKTLSMQSVPAAWLPLALGAVAAGVVGWIALAVLIPLVRRGKLHYFAAYLIPLAIVALLLIHANEA